MSALVTARRRAGDDRRGRGALAELAEGDGLARDFDTHGVTGGNGRIADALAAGLPEPVRLPAHVTALAQDGHGVRATTGQGSFDADAAVVAVPARVIDEIAFDPPLPDAKRTRSLRFGHAAKLFVRLREPAPASATLSVPRALLVVHAGLPRRAAGAGAGRLAGSEETLRALRVDDGPDTWLDAIAALRPDLALDRAQVLLSTWHDAPHIRALQVARSVERPMDDEELARPLGRLAFAGEHTAGAVWHGTMEGAIRSGQRAAANVPTLA